MFSVLGGDYSETDMSNPVFAFKLGARDVLCYPQTYPKGIRTPGMELAFPMTSDNAHLQLLPQSFLTGCDTKEGNTSMNHTAHGLSDGRQLSANGACGWHRRHDSVAIGILGAVVSLVISIFPLPAYTEDDFLSYQQFVKYDNDNVSVALSNVRASEAAQLMRSATGVMITLPTSTQSKTINLELKRARMEQAIHSLLSALQLNNSFLVYDRDGRLTDVVALEKGEPQIWNESSPSDENQQKTEYKDITAPEREALVREFRLWSKLSEEDRGAIHARLKTIPPSKERDALVKEYVRLVLGLSESEPETAE